MKGVGRASERMGGEKWLITKYIGGRTFENSPEVLCGVLLEGRNSE